MTSNRTIITGSGCNYNETIEGDYYENSIFKHSRKDLSTQNTSVNTTLTSDTNIADIMEELNTVEACVTLLSDEAQKNKCLKAIRSIKRIIRAYN